jgi:mRNA interferase MazF
MPIKYALAPSTVLICDYAMGGFREPEMVKKRPAVVISPRLPHRDGLCTVVPLSGSEPDRELPYVVRLEFHRSLPKPFEQNIWWAKCDMLATVGFARLDQFRTERDHTGRRQYLQPKVSKSDLTRLQQGVLHALGLGAIAIHLTQAGETPS